MSFTCLSFDAEGAEDESQLPDNRVLVDVPLRLIR